MDAWPCDGVKERQDSEGRDETRGTGDTSEESKDRKKRTRKRNVK